MCLTKDVYNIVCIFVKLDYMSCVCVGVQADALSVLLIWVSRFRLH